MFDFFSGLFESIGSAMSAAGSAAASAASDVGEGLGNMAGKAWEGVGDAAKDAARSMAEQGAEQKNPLSRFSLSWDNAAKAAGEVGKAVGDTLPEARLLYDAFGGEGGLSWDKLANAGGNYAKSRIGAELASHGTAGKLAAAMMGAAAGGGAKKQEQEQTPAAQTQTQTQPQQTQVQTRDDSEAGTRPGSTAAYYGQFGAAPAVTANNPLKFDFVQYYNNLWEKTNGGQ